MNREDFPMLLNDIIYFDNGATTFKPKSVIDKICSYYTDYSANAHRGDYDISYKVDMEFENARDLIKDFINAEKREEIVFTSGTTNSINLITEGFFKNILEAGDEILITESEHASNVLPWFKLAASTGAIVNYIPLTDDYHVTLNNIINSVTSRTKVISIAHVTNVVGDLRPIKEICEYAHSKDIFVVIDGAQGLPHFKVDVKDLDVDFYTASAHKMCGPTGVGLLYGKENLLEEINPVTLGGGMNESFDNITEVYYKDLPHRLEAGTQNIAGVIGFGETIKYLSSIGMEKIEIYERNLRKYLIDGLVKIPHIDIINIESDSAIVSFNIDGIFAQDVAYYLNKYNICVRAGNHCAKNLKNVVKVSNTLRISLYFYNTETEIDTLLELLKNKEKIENEMF